MECAWIAEVALDWSERERGKRFGLDEEVEGRGGGWKGGGLGRRWVSSCLYVYIYIYIYSKQKRNLITSYITSIRLAPPSKSPHLATRTPNTSPSTLYPLSSTLYPLPSTLYPLPFILYPLPSTLYTLHPTYTDTQTHHQPVHPPSAFKASHPRKTNQINPSIPHILSSHLIISSSQSRSHILHYPIHWAPFNSQPRSSVRILGNAQDPG